MKKIKAILRDISYFFKGLKFHKWAGFNETVDLRIVFYKRTADWNDDVAFRLEIRLVLLGFYIQIDQNTKVCLFLSFDIPFWRSYMLSLSWESYLREMEENALWEEEQRKIREKYAINQEENPNFEVRGKGSFDIKIDTDKSCQSLRDDLKNLEL